MIWIRRLITVPLGILFFLLMLVAVLLLQVHDMFLDPDFYTEELRDADAYEFLLVNLLPSAIEDARGVRPGESIFVDLEVNPVVESRLSTRDIVDAVNRAIPPEWLQEQVEEAFDQFGGFLTLERDDFSFTVRAGGQVPIIVEEIKDLLRKADAYNLLFEEVLVPAVEEGITQDLPLGLEIPGDRLVEAMRTIVSPDWVQRQVEAALDEASAYMTGEKPSLQISVELADRVDIALNEIKDILRELDVYEVLYDEVVAPELLRALGAAVSLPSGVAITRDEVVSSLRNVAPVEWVREQVERLIDEAGPYLAGRKDRFSVRVSLRDNKQQARIELLGLVEGKLEQAVGRLLQCAITLSLQDLRALETQARGGATPECIPAALDRARLVDTLRDRIGAQVDGLVLSSIPDNITFTQDNLLEALRLAGAQENVDRIDEVRQILRDGWSYTDADLRQDLRQQFPQDGIRFLDNLRSYLADGWTYGKDDLRIALRRRSSAGSGDTLDDIQVNLSYIGDYTAGEMLRDVLDVREADDVDKFRGYLDNARSFRWLIALPALLLLAIVGYLGGTSGPGRLAYASVVLVVSATIILVAFGPVYNASSQGALEELRQEMFDKLAKEIDGEYEEKRPLRWFDGTVQMTVDKALEVIESVTDRFDIGVMKSALLLLILGLAALVGSIAWGRSRPPRLESRRVATHAGEEHF